MSRGRAALAGTGAALLLLPSDALAHGLVGKSDLPIPRWLFAWAAAVVLVVSFAALATLWPKPRLEQREDRPLARLPRILDPLCGLLGLALFAVVVYAGLAGRQEASANLAPTWIYVIFWVGLAFASFLFGDVFRAFSPWRTLARGAAFAAGRLGAGSPALRYPERLGRWPAVVSIAGFAWLELVYSNKDVPQTLAILALLYAAVQLVGMALYGIETWTERGDGFAVYFGLFARLSPLRWQGGRLWSRPPFAAAVGLEMLPGTVALLCVMIGSTSFDGLSVGSLWVGPGNGLSTVQGWFTGLGADVNTADELAATLGLLAMIGLVGGLYRLGLAGMRTISDEHDTRELSRRFAHSLLPIALAYVVAHYFSLLIYQGQALGYLASDPLGDGSNLLGGAATQIDYNLVSANAVWYVQVAALITGHAAGLVLAHDRALVIYRRSRDAARSQYWMLAVMVGFTSLGLWILSATQ
ncbi:MAG: hypothetical protein NVSMB51_00770 [Solirubrobacteraceae bacterium]